jgi:hypothetical protein
MRSRWVTALNELHYQLQLQGIDLYQMFSVQRQTLSNTELYC